MAMRAVPAMAASMGGRFQTGMAAATGMGAGTYAGVGGKTGSAGADSSNAAICPIVPGRGADSGKDVGAGSTG